MAKQPGGHHADDRELQRAILKHLASIYAFEHSHHDTWQVFQSLPGGNDRDNLIANVRYLEAHGLLESGLRYSVDGMYSMDSANTKITLKGLDFLADDGGLSAVLNCVTVKLHDDSLAQIEKFLAQAPLEAHVKTGYLARLRSLPADATRHLLMKVLDLGLANAPAALQLIQKLLT